MYPDFPTQLSVTEAQSSSPSPSTRSTTSILSYDYTSLSSLHKSCTKKTSSSILDSIRNFMIAYKKNLPHGCKKAEPRDKSADQRSADHYHLELREMLSMKGRSSVRSRVRSRVRLRTGKVTIGEECLKRLHSVKGRNATNLVCANVSLIL